MSGTVLLIDYDPRSIGRIRGLLRGAGLHTFLARDGLSGVEIFERVKTRSGQPRVLSGQGQPRESRPCAPPVRNAGALSLACRSWLACAAPNPLRRLVGRSERWPRQRPRIRACGAPQGN